METEKKIHSASENLPWDPGHLSSKSQQGELTLLQGLEENGPTGGTQSPWTRQGASARVSEILSEE